MSRQEGRNGGGGRTTGEPKALTPTHRKRQKKTTEKHTDATNLTVLQLRAKLETQRSPLLLRSSELRLDLRNLLREVTLSGQRRSSPRGGSGCCCRQHLQDLCQLSLVNFALLSTLTKTCDEGELLVERDAELLGLGGGGLDLLLQHSHIVTKGGVKSSPLHTKLLIDLAQRLNARRPAVFLTLRRRRRRRRGST